MKRKLLALVPIAMFLFLPTSVALAQEAPGTIELAPLAILSTLLYGTIGIILCVAGYFAFDKIARLDLQRELVEDQNIALGIMLAGVFIGISIVVAAVMIS